MKTEYHSSDSQAQPWGVAIFRRLLTFTLTGVLVLGLSGCGKKDRDAQNEDDPETPQPAVETQEPASSDAGSGETTPETSGSTSTSTSTSETGEASTAEESGEGSTGLGYVTVDTLAGDLLQALKDNDIAKFVDLAGAPAAGEVVKTRLSQLFLKRRYEAGLDDPQKGLQGEGDQRALEIPLNPPPALAFLGTQRLKAKLARDAERGWGVTSLEVPDIEAIAAAYVEEGQEDGDEKAATPVAAAGAFLDAVVKRDFGKARALANAERLSDEKLAALFIVVEEGDFKAHDQRPLIATAARNNSAWVIARLKSSAEESDFGIEMERSNEEKAWEVVGLNFSKLIQTAAVEAGAGDVAYAPLKTDLKSGDQLVLFFEFDTYEVNPRAAKQLKIISDILKEDPARSLYINGHADAKGQEDYNEALSAKRAQEVRDALIAHGIPEGQIVTRSFGESKPNAPNFNPDGTDNPTGRAQNRRAEVHLEF